MAAIKAAQNQYKNVPPYYKPALDLTIKDSDFANLLTLTPSEHHAETDVVMSGECYVDTSSQKNVNISNSAFATQDNAETVRKNLPKVIANKVKEMVPDGFELTELSFTGEISGKPFGVGVSGSVTATFKKKES